MVLIARLVREGRLIRADGPYERHYPEIRDAFVAKVQRLIAISRQKP